MKKIILTGLAALLLHCGTEPAISIAEKNPEEPPEEQQSAIPDSYTGFAEKGFFNGTQAYGTQDPTQPLSAFHGNIIPEINYHLDKAIEQANRSRTPLNFSEYPGLTTFFKPFDIETFLQEYETNATLRTAFEERFGTSFNDLWTGPTLLYNNSGFDAAPTNNTLGYGIIPEQGTTNYRALFALKGTEQGNTSIIYSVSPPLDTTNTADLKLAFTYWETFVKR